MAAITWIPLVLAALVLYVVVNKFIIYRKLRQFKGPFLASISELWILKETAQGRLYLGAADALVKYGSPARIGPNMVITDDPVIIRAMAAPRSAFRRGNWFDGMKFDPRIDNILSEKDEKRHAELRTKLIGGYSGKDIPTLESDIDDRIVDLLNLINREKANHIDFARFAQYFTLDALTQIAFGYPFGYLSKNEDLYDYVKTTMEFLPIMELGCNVTYIHSFLTSRIMQALAAPKPEDRIGLGAVIGVAKKVVAERFGPDAKVRQDMLGSFVAHGLTQQEAESESLLQILAGADSTATTIRMTFLYLLTHHAVCTKLIAEIDEAVAKGGISHPVIKYSEAKQLPYLQACILEGLRIFVPLNGIADKFAPSPGETINGVYFPPGTQVAFNLHRVMRREDIWGPDSDVFRPERWTEADKETRTKYERTQELIFGCGRSSCLGKNIALMELNKIFVELLRNYEWSIVNPLQPMTSKSFAIHIQKYMYLRATPRKMSGNPVGA